MKKGVGVYLVHQVGIAGAALGRVGPIAGIAVCDVGLVRGAGRGWPVISDVRVVFGSIDNAGQAGKAAVLLVVILSVSIPIPIPVCVIANRDVAADVTVACSVVGVVIVVALGVVAGVVSVSISRCYAGKNLGGKEC
ncbi:MAG: hypothetical protein WBK77_00585 [Alphaproteobacteria bacterium]